MMIGKIIHNYQILDKITEGGMGLLFRAWDTKLNRPVVLKFLSAKLIEDQLSKERFLQEARAAAAINHPNIITIYEIDEFEDQMYIAMEFVDGVTLQEKIITPVAKEGKTFKWEDLLDILIQLGEGIKKAHEKGVIHRDIKPQNIMITSDNRVKILDFGIAKLKKVRKLTQDFMTLGTLQYMSPEQLSGLELDLRTDIWSFGVLAYEMLAGQLPFRADQPQRLIYSILEEEPQPVTLLRPELPEQVDDIILKALSKDRDVRYLDMAHLVDDLKIFRRETDRLLTTSIGVPQTTGRGVPIAVAVLPFLDLSPAQDQEYFCDGISEEIINVLARIEGLKVAPRTASFQFRGKAHNIQEISKKLKAQFILEGSVQKSKSRLRISTSIISAIDGCYVWSERYDRRMKDIFAIQDEITQAVVHNLKIKVLGGSASTDLSSHQTYNMDAYNLYLKGRYFWNRRYAGGLKKAIEFFQAAIAEDPKYALPYVGIADALNIIGLYGLMPPAQAFLQAKKMSAKSLELNEKLTEAYASLGWISNFYDWDWEQAEKEFKQAIALNPQYPTAHEWYAVALTMRGKLVEAEEKVRQAMELDPLSLIINAVLGVIYLFSRRYREAGEQLGKTIEMDPNFMLARIWMGDVYMFTGMVDKSIEEFKKAVSISGEMTYALADLGYVYGIAGRTEDALQVLAQLQEIEAKAYLSQVQKAMVYTALKRYDEALTALERACQQRDPFCLWVKCAPHFDPIRDNPRFSKFLADIGTA